MNLAILKRLLLRISIENILSIYGRKIGSHILRFSVILTLSMYFKRLLMKDNGL